MAQVPSATPAATPARTHALGSYHRKSSGSSDAANSGESPLGSDKHSCPIARLMKRTGYSIVQENGQRRYGPPPDWEGEAPSGGCEVCVNKIPRDCFEDELVPVFDRIGKIYELRLIMDYIGLNKGYAFVVYGDVASAKESARQLNNYEIRKGRTLSVCMTVDNCRLFVRGIPKKVTKERIKQKVQEVTEGVMDVIVYHSAIDKTKNKGFAFVEYDRHQAAVMALWNLRHGRLFLWGNQLHVDWATPDLEVDKEIMAQVKVQYIRNLMLSTTESTIEEVFSVHAPVNRVKKIIDHALVYFHSKEDAHKAMNQLNGSILDGAEIQVMLAKPTRKTGLDASQRTPKFNRIATLPAVGSAIYPASSYSITPKFSLGECTKVRMCGNRGRNFLPSQMVQPNQGLAMPSPLYTATQGFGGGYVPLPGAGYAEPPTSFSAAAAGTITQGVIIPKPHKNAVQFLEEVCAKSSWPPPVYTLHTPSTGDTRFFVYKVALTSIGVAYMPEKLSRTIEEAKSAAAEYTLSQLGYCSEVRVTASSYPALPTQPLPLTNTATGYAAPSVPTAYNPHPTTAATAAIYLFPDPYQQIYGSP